MRKETGGGYMIGKEETRERSGYGGEEEGGEVEIKKVDE